MRFRQGGFISFGTMTLLIGGLALVGLLVYGAKTGQELPLWPALTVVLLNLFAAGKIVFDVKKKRQRVSQK